MRSVQVVRTYLEMNRASELVGDEGVEPANARIERIGRCAPAFYRFLYNEVGQHWNWIDRAAWTDERIAQHLEGAVTIWVLFLGGDAAGWFELVEHDDRSIEIAYFGLFEHAIGRRIGPWMLGRAVREAWSFGATRVWLHTCTLDHPGALAMYLKRGFVKTSEETYRAEIP